MKSIRWRIILVVVVLLIALFKIYPTIKWSSQTSERKEELTERWKVIDQELQEDREHWRKQRDVRDEIEKELKASGKRIPQKPSMFRNIGIGLTRWWYGDEDQVLPLGLDLKGGIRIELHVDAENINQVLTKLMNRIDQFGVAEPDIRKAGNDKITIELPGATDIERARRLIEEQAFMEWMLVEEKLMQKPLYTPERLQAKYNTVLRELKDLHQGDIDEYGNPVVPTFDEIDAKMKEDDYLPETVICRIWEHKNILSGEMTKVPLLLRMPSAITGDQLIGNKISRSTGDKMDPRINFVMNSEAAKEFREVTAEYNAESNPIVENIRESRGWRLAIVVDDKIISAPNIQTEITGGKGVITGIQNTAVADKLVVQLRSGSLAVKPDIISIIQVGPRLGADSIRMGVRAAMLGLILVVFFMAIYYLKSGLIAVFALCLNILIILAALSTLGATLTLPGIAGIILTIGMAVDANVLIFERIREEFAAAKKMKAAIISGYEKAFRTILDANLTTLITALILYKFGTGPIKGFAVTLSLGIAASMFTALFVTRLVFEVLMRMKSFESLKMLRFFSQPNIDFISFTKKALMISGAVIIIGVASFATNFRSMLGIDFAGGDELVLKFEENIDIAEVRKIVQSDLGYSDAQVRVSDKEGDRTDKVSIQSRDAIKDGTDKEIAKLMGIKLVDDGVNYTKVGPAHAVTLWHKAIIAMVLSLAGIIIYVWIRFEFIFGIAAVVALLHDVVITLGVFSGMFVLGARQINLPIIAAILTIIGYSLNDTIVVFDRIREDLKILKRLSFRDIVNTSINQTLSRTMLTSVTTLLVVLSLLVLGGQAVSDFAFAMFIGIIVGTYSSVFIASPILLLFFHKKRT